MILKALLGVGAIFLMGLVPETKGSAEIMSHVTVGFGKALDECREESGLSEEIMEEFHHFWREDFEVVHRELGCAIICMSNKFSIIKEDTRIHHNNMEAWIKSFPQGDVLSAKMVKMIHECEKQFENIEDNCSRVVKVARCFKDDCFKEGIAPEMAMMEAVLEQYK